MKECKALLYGLYTLVLSTINGYADILWTDVVGRCRLTLSNPN